MPPKRNNRHQSRIRRLFATKKRRWGVGIGALLVIIFIITAIQHANKEKDAAKTKYNIMKVTSQADFNLTGKIEPVQTQTLTLPSGKLQGLNVKNGDHVTQGEAILTMHNDNTQDSVAELQADLGKSQRTMNTQQQTVNNLRQQLNGMNRGDEGYADLQNQLNEAQNAYADAQASVNSTQQRLNTASGKVNQTLTAPFSGYVTVDQSKQSEPVVTLYSDTLQFVGQVSEYDYSKLHQSTNLTVKALATNRQANTQVSYLATIPTKSTGNNTKYEVTANVNANKFMAGQTAKASVKQDGVQIPKSAVRHGKVFVVGANDRVRETEVSGHAFNSSYIVTDGVDAGDRIVTNPNSKLKDNAKVD
ncbi:efflux RND transporter periplasmic adaptor subunit [Limosilactobacillus sp. STM2_1]|uniref:Efflux RND transporter periplasmic adaptor subunit n=1 Tax=Limosilactobacillus rudii TaxID=2759755 RepID=A0A7W3UJ55_9LACO|nr:efflux RND transporter periplasmic adaptor subunit [Limosilactobacillus rudii]MBB1078421.1 efflux RND transporter periplasmic adaptor subunit [Limosilactobacillus rudii]MBB1096551.1 efflux RND transporter periplasmic adaptor subunit [Limosilactobacillus rudii]MCD7134253.1 efflux RND transporter periplasmic adaptor subunit [Limosilactobacillus rudii]